jgi:hypothetical protein
MLTSSEFLTLKESKNLKVFLNILDVRGVKTADDALKNREQVRTTLNSWIDYANSREDTRTFYTKEKQDAVKVLNSLIKHDELGDDEPVIQHLEKDAQHCESGASNRDRLAPHYRQPAQGLTALPTEFRPTFPNRNCPEPAQHMFTIKDACEVAGPTSNGADQRTRPTTHDQAVALQFYENLLNVPVPSPDPGPTKISKSARRRRKKAARRKRNQQAERAHEANKHAAPSVKPCSSLVEFILKKTFCFAQYAKNMPMERPTQEPAKKRRRTDGRRERD